MGNKLWGEATAMDEALQVHGGALLWLVPREEEDRLLPSKRLRGWLSCLRCGLGCETLGRGLGQGGIRITGGEADALNEAAGTADLPPL